MGLLPRRVESERAPESARVLDIEGVEADRAFEALSSETARRILSHIYEQPSTPPEVRDEVGTSLQNVHYHLGRLEEADLIEPAGVGYSEKGNEMTIFAPKSEAVVLFAGHEHDRSRLSRLLGRVLGLYLFLAVAVAAAGSLRELLAPAGPTADSAVSLSAETAGDAGASSADTVAGGAAGLLANPDPLLLFFLGGLVAIVVLTGYWYARGV
ncbi:helix-turn-helix domain-containing protein [Salinirubellus salinus]|jgi:DNA-binding transcriptional ArsR family regulator|uniref:Helix-turn-helix domain-containing protein n=1 Tax=Salinirubellus salinus TaxID=1364945 RepID=A0A9E7R5F6_9EURY|nr:helix-turn-helix domain-containing protein [Salinirubellus salinus]UWM56240.1 helix-turn-helix domain-containing protein [Salinirubellus salinus]